MRTATTFLGLTFNDFPLFVTSCKRPLDAFSDLFVRCVHYATKNMRRTLVTTWDYTCHNSKTLHALNGCVWTSSEKRPPVFRFFWATTHSVFAFWVVAYGRFDCSVWVPRIPWRLLSCCKTDWNELPLIYYCSKPNYWNTCKGYFWLHCLVDVVVLFSFYVKKIIDFLSISWKCKRAYCFKDGGVPILDQYGGAHQMMGSWFNDLIRIIASWFNGGKSGVVVV